MLIGAGDCRHVLKTCAHMYRHSPVKINVSIGGGEILFVLNSDVLLVMYYRSWCLFALKVKVLPPVNDLAFLFKVCLQVTFFSPCPLLPPLLNVLFYSHQINGEKMGPLPVMCKQTLGTYPHQAKAGVKAKKIRN